MPKYRITSRRSITRTYTVVSEETPLAIKTRIQADFAQFNAAAPIENVGDTALIVMSGELVSIEIDPDEPEEELKHLA